jgi:hypothetical protein
MEANSYTFHVLLHLSMDHSVNSNVDILHAVQDTVEAIMCSMSDSRKLASLVRIGNHLSCPGSNQGAAQRCRPSTTHTDSATRLTAKTSSQPPSKDSASSILPAASSTVVPLTSQNT